MFGAVLNLRLTLSPGLPGQPPQRQAGVVPRRGRGEEGEQLQQQRGQRGPDKVGEFEHYITLHEFSFITHCTAVQLEFPKCTTHNVLR